MRVTGGSARGRNIYVPKSDKIRATSDRIRESLFNILPDVGDLFFLDIFAGAGSVGVEALSRGSAGTVFIEREPLHAIFIDKNLKICGFDKSGEVIVNTADKGIRILAARNKMFDIIFADPPYDKGLVSGLLGVKGLSDIITEDGILVVEHSSREKIAADGLFVPVDQRRYGDTVLSFLERNI